MKKVQLRWNEMIIDYRKLSWVKPRRGEMIIENGDKPFRQTPKGLQNSFIGYAIQYPVTPSGFDRPWFMFSIIMSSLRDYILGHFNFNPEIHG